MNVKQYIAGRAAKELCQGDVVNLGIGIPTLVANYISPDVHVFYIQKTEFSALALLLKKPI